MTCGHPDCTGRHGTSGPVANVCPVALQRKRDGESQQKVRRYASDPEYRERKRQHGANQRARLAARRNALLAAQGGVCPCGLPLPPEDAVLDHDHSCCDKEAKLACGSCDRAAMHANCNTALGMLSDSPSILRRLANWLESDVPLNQLATTEAA